jgi:endonuclease/exonuclease/phosphatase family metal-dependent hydrolase
MGRARAALQGIQIAAEAAVSRISPQRLSMWEHPKCSYTAQESPAVSSPVEHPPDRTVSVVSLNLARENRADKVVSAIQNSPRLRDADLFLFQEVRHTRAGLNVAEEIARHFGYFSLFEPTADNVYDQGLALVSRHPVGDAEITRLKACDLRYRSRNRFAVAATMRTPWGALRVWNAHLDTRINAEERLEQLQPVITEASRQTGPRLIGGDFNTNELYWLRNVLPLPGGASHRAAIRRAMLHHGFETPLPNNVNTFPALRRHLDWIFVRDLKPMAASVERAPFSDHNAIWVRVGF